MPICKREIGGEGIGRWVAKTAKRGGGRDRKKGTKTFASRLDTYKNCLA